MNSKYLDDNDKPKRVCSKCVKLYPKDELSIEGPERKELCSDCREE